MGMIDLEKVIEALEACVLKDPDDSRDCRHCPRCNYGAFITTSCINGVMADALALLKAQEPRNVSDVFMVHEGKLGNCPACGAELMDYYNETHCGRCGQAVKWNV